MKKANIDTFKSYRTTNIEWMPQVPAHWSVDRLKWHISFSKNGAWGSDPNGTNEIVCIRVADFDRIKQLVVLNDPTIRSFDKRELNDRVLEKGDLLIEKSGGGENQLVGVVVEFNLEIEAVNSNFIGRLKIAGNQWPRYWVYFHSYLYSIKRNYLSINQTTGIQNLDLGNYLNEFACYPPFNEQQSIATFLDQKTKQIDDLIEQKEKIFRLLTEKRTAIITQAVTKGLDPKAKMKASGVEWLGEVPEHWDLRRLRFLAYINPVKSELKAPDDVLVSFVPMEAVGEYGGLTLDTEKEISEVYTGYTYFRNNDVVVAKITPCFENGKGALASDLKNGIAFGTTELHVLRGELLESRYLFYLSICDFFRKTGEAWMYGAGGQKRVPEEFLKDLIVPMPPPREQKEIGEWLETRIESFHASQNAIETSIAKLKEYRDALITSAVTGQIDLRN